MNLFKAVIANPPFGSASEEIYGIKFTALEHIIAIRTLDTMYNEGRAAIIVGGNMEYDNEGRIQAGKNRTFYLWLYHHYNVVDIINVSGDLYRKMGTTFPIRIILIHGRRQSEALENLPPFYNDIKHLPERETNSPKPVETFEALYDRFSKLS